MAYVSDVTPPEKRAQGMGWVGAAMSLGFVIGPALGGVLGGSDAGSASLLLPGLVAFAIAGGTTIATVFFLKESLPAEKRAEAAAAGAAGRRARPAGAGAAAADDAPAACSGFAVYVAMAMFETIFPFWTKAQFQWGPREVGLSFTYLAVVVGVMQGFVVGRLAPVFGEGKLAIAGLASYAVGLVWMTQSPSWPIDAGRGDADLRRRRHVPHGHVQFRLEDGRRHASAGWCSAPISRRAGPGRSLGPVMSGTLFNVLGHHSPLLAGAMLMLPCIALLVTIMARNASLPAGPSADEPANPAWPAGAKDL